MGQDSSAPFSAVQIITQTYVVVGRCKRLTEYTRLLDLLNNPDISHLEILNAKVRWLSHSVDVTAIEGPLFVEKTRIVFASTLETAEEMARRREARRVDHVERDKHPVLVFASPFRILGNVYLAKGADPEVALPKLFHSFLAMTETKAVHESDNGLAWENDFVVVNGRCIEMICSSPPQAWRSEQFGGRGAAHIIDDRELQDIFGLSSLN